MEEYYVVCPGCGGKGKLTCDTCNGTGRYKNPFIFGAEEEPCSNCKNGIMNCRECHGEGKLLTDDENEELNRSVIKGYVTPPRVADSPSSSSEEDNFTGRKKVTYDDGSVYEGDFVNGEFHGKGKFTWKEDGVTIIYEGGFVNGVFQGKGKKTWTDNGDCYEGDFFDGAQHGKGKLKYADGRVYIGDYANGKRNGKGKMTYPDGKVEEGRFEDGKFVGK